MNNVSLMEWIFWYFGSCLTGYPAEMIVNFYGKNSAKNTLVNVIKNIIGDYYAPLSRELLLKERKSFKNNMPLSGIRFASIDLGEESVTLNTNNLISIMETSIKPLILSENKISLSGINTGGKLIFCFVPFSEKDKRADFSEDELLKEGPGILGQLVQYSHKYIQNGNKLPQCNEVEIVKT